MSATETVATACVAHCEVSLGNYHHRHPSWMTPQVRVFTFAHFDYAFF
jgi:hypothetical protein